jgi:hypothetical protein
VRPSIGFLAATIRHKLEVYRAGRKLGLGRWQLIIHDLSKFRPSEFIPYGRYAYSAVGASYRKALIDPSQKEAVAEAWLRHFQRNPHHWQHWCFLHGASKMTSCGAETEVARVEAVRMPERYVREMLADWMGAAATYQGTWPQDIASWKWWQDNKQGIVLHPDSRDCLGRVICDWFKLPPESADQVWSYLPERLPALNRPAEEQ